MATSIDWITGIITVPRADMTLIQLSPVEIREHDTNAFRLELRDLEDDVDGRPWSRTHDHNEDVLVGGISLADVLLILAPYTVTYEDGQYAVYLQGTNNNILERTNKNQVSVNPSNSAGLVNSRAIESISFYREVCIDESSPYSGTIGGVGTLKKPVNNIPDGLIIAAFQGFEKFHVHGPLTIGTGHNVDGFIFEGHGPEKTTITIEDAASTVGCEFKECELNGILDGSTILTKCKVGNLQYVNGEIRNSRITGPVFLGGSANALILDCCSDQPAVPAIIDMGGSGQDIFLADWSGAVKFQNMTGDNKIGIQMDGGRVFLEPSISAGFIGIVGVGERIGNPTGTAQVDDSALVNKTTVASAVWSEFLSSYTFGQAGHVLQALAYGKEVILDSVNGVSGTGPLTGTRAQPSNNLADTLTLCAQRGLVRIMTRTGFTVQAGQDISGMSIATHGILGTDIIFEAGCIAHQATIRFANISGELSPNDFLFIESCSVGNLENFTGIMNLATLGEGCELSVGLWANLIDCHCGGEPTNEPEISIGACSLSIIGYSGNIKLIKKTGINRTVINFISGNISIASTCVLGKIQILGVCAIEADNSGPDCKVDVDAALPGLLSDKMMDLRAALYNKSVLTKISNLEYTERIFEADKITPKQDFNITKSDDVETRDPV